MVRRSQESDAGWGSDGCRTDLNPRSFAAFYERSYPNVLRWFIRRTHNGQQAIDLTAETFAKAFERREAYRGATEREALGWLYSIANRELLQLYRRGKVETAALARLQLYRPPPSEDEARQVEQLIDATAARTPLREALDELSPQQRQVFESHVIEEESHSEIAEKLQISDKAVRTSLHRARRRLASNRRLRRIVEGDPQHG